MRINYPKAIGESEEELLNLEQRLRGQKRADRVRMLRRLEKRDGEEFARTVRRWSATAQSS
jgi:hypothetical protein